MHVEMASREFAEIELISQIAARMDVAVGIVDVKSYYIETAEDIANRVRLCLKHAPADRLVFAFPALPGASVSFTLQPQGLGAQGRNGIAGLDATALGSPGPAGDDDFFELGVFRLRC
jgi:hypothetical protein